MDHQVGFYYQYPSLIFPQGKTLKNWKASDQKIQDVKIDQYRDHFVEKSQSFHIFYDVFCEILTGQK